MSLMDYASIGNKLAATAVMPITAAMSVTPPHANLDIFGIHIRNTLLFVKAKSVSFAKLFKKLDNA